jgi:PKD repeat protein
MKNGYISAHFCYYGQSGIPMRKTQGIGLIAVALVLIMLLSGASDASFGQTGNDSDDLLSSMDFFPKFIEQREENFSAFPFFSQTVGTANWPKLASIGDLNNDSALDVAVASESLNIIEIFLQDENGFFSQNPDQVITLSDTPTGMDIGDIDGDLLDDILVSIGSEDRVYLCYQSNGFIFEASASASKNTFTNPVGVRIADFDGDEKNDFAVISNPGLAPPNSTFTVHLKRNSLNYIMTHYLDNQGIHNCSTFMTHDFNGDNKVDLVFGDAESNVVILFENTIATPGEDSWLPFQTLGPGGPVDISFKQVDMVGQEEMIVVAQDAGEVRIYRYNSSQDRLNLWINHDVFYSPSTASMMDVNSDGVPELFVGSQANQTIQAFTINVPGSVAMEFDSFPCQFNPIQSLSGDIDGDGLDDLLVLSNRSGGNGTYTIYYQPENGSPSNADSNLIFDTGMPTDFVLGDFDESGISTIAAMAMGQDKLVFTRNDTVLSNSKQLWQGPHDLVSADLVGGNDLAVTNGGSNNLSLFWSEPSFFGSSSASLEVDLNFTWPSSLMPGDISGDGLIDLIVGCEGGVEILYNIGVDPYFSNISSFSLLLATGNFTGIAAGNFNLDSNVDIAVVNASGNRIEVYLNGGGGIPFTSSADHVLHPSGSGSISWISSGFVNDDALEDIAVAKDDGTITIFLQGAGYGFDDGEVIVAGSPLGLNDADLGDFDDDGLDEIAVFGDELEVVTLFDFSGTSAEMVANFTAGAGNGFVGVDDFDGDLREDVLFSSPLSSTVSIVYQNNLNPSAVPEVTNVGPIFEGRIVNFTGINSIDSFSDMDTLQYSWDFGDGQYGSGVNVAHTYMDNDTYAATLTVTDRGGLSDETQINVVVNDDSPVAEFTYPPSSEEGVEVNFDSISTSYPDSIVSWSWDFGDGGSTDGESVAHVFMDNGTYEVILTVVDEDGSPDSISHTITISDRTPLAEFDYLESADEGDSIYFNSTSTSYPDEIISWTWEFGDWQSDSGESVTHSYLDDGEYIVTLTVVDEDGSYHSVSHTITINDRAPMADFSIPGSPDEGEPVVFTSTSTSYPDSIVSWSWDFGDGESDTGVTVQHTYANNGTYSVTLTVIDEDGSEDTLVLIIDVGDTSPTGLSLQILSGPSPFDEDQPISYRVSYQYQWDEPERFEWDFNYNGVFQSDKSTEVNQTSFSYAQEGIYRIAVRVWDNDSYATTTVIQIEIENVPPSAHFSYQDLGKGNMSFDASLSDDTSSDVEGLNYRWNFNDTTGWSEWGTNPYVQHHFSKDGEYTVTVEVKDDDGSIDSFSREVTVDITKPNVVLLSLGEDAIVGESIVISANISDMFGIESVVLHYWIAEQEYEIPMTQSQVPSVYTAQIPAQNSTGTILYSIEAIDTNGNGFTTQTFEIQVSNAPMPSWIYAFGIGIPLIAVVGVVAFARRRSAIDDVFIIFEDGCLIAHETRRLKPGMDDEVLGSMFVAIQDFVRDSFKDEEDTSLKGMDFGKKRILVEKGDSIYMAAVLHGKGGLNTGGKMHQVIDDIEEEYGETLTNWDGDLEKLRGVKDKTKPLLGLEPGAWSIIVSKIRTSREVFSKRGDVGVQCPICNENLSQDADICPKCGTEFSMGDIDDLERIADSISDNEPKDDDVLK